MIVFQTTGTVKNLSARDTQNFLLNCTDEMYQKSWPGVHIQKHPIKKGGPDHIGDVIYAFEHVGKHTIEVTMKVTEYIPEKILKFRVKMGIAGSLVPVYLHVETMDMPEGVHLLNRFSLGWSGIGRILDPVIGFFFPKELRDAMDEHVATEWPLIAASIK